MSNLSGNDPSRAKRDGKRREERLDGFKKISYSDLTIISSIGSGGFGNVSKVQYQLEDVVLILAYKYPNSGIEPISETDRLAIKDEAAKLVGLKHDNIVQLFAIVDEPNHFGLLMEYLEFGDMQSYFAKSKTRPSAIWVCSWILDTAIGVEFLHHQRPPIIHGDLKIENVLISHDKKAKITDFGLAFWKEYSKEYSVSNVYSGTPKNIPPEYMQNHNLRKEEKFDVYGFGIFMFESITRMKAFRDQRVIEGCVQNGIRPSTDFYADEYPTLLKTLTAECWDNRPDKRPFFPEICERLFHILNECENVANYDDVDAANMSQTDTRMTSMEPADEFEVEMVSADLGEDDGINMVSINSANENDKLLDMQQVIKNLQMSSYNIQTQLSKLKLQTEYDIYGNYQILQADHDDWGPTLYRQTVLKTDSAAVIELNYLWRELKIHLKLSHPNILKFMGFVHETGYFGLVFEQSSLGTLKYLKRCNEDEVISSKEKLRMLYDLSVGLSYLHSKSIIHCCIKTENVYVDEKRQVKLSNFQFAQEKTDNAKLAVYRFKKEMAYHIPKEYFEDSNLVLREQIDVYGFAWVIFEVLNTVGMFETLKKLLPRVPITEKKIGEFVAFGWRPVCEFPRDVSDEIVEIVKKCFEVNYEELPSIVDLMKLMESA